MVATYQIGYVWNDRSLFAYNIYEIYLADGSVNPS